MKQPNNDNLPKSLNLPRRKFYNIKLKNMIFVFRLAACRRSRGQRPGRVLLECSTNNNFAQGNEFEPLLGWLRQSVRARTQFLSILILFQLVSSQLYLLSSSELETAEISPASVLIYNLWMNSIVRQSLLFQSDKS